MESEKTPSYGFLGEAVERWPCYDIIVVHGICQTAWTTEGWKECDGPKKSTSWIRDTFGLQKSEISHFHYDISGEFPPVLRPGGIKSEAQKLLDGIVQWREMADSYKNKHEEELRPIIFIAHDIGGIIVKQSLILAARNFSKYGSIPYCTKNILFLGCPHRASTRVLQDSLFQLFAYRGWLPVGDAADLLPTLANSIQKVNSEFLDTKLLLRSSIYNIFSERSPGTESGLYPFPPSACHIYVPYELHYSVPVSHVDLAVSSGTYQTARVMRSCLGNIRKNLANSFYFLYSNKEQAPSNKIFLAVAPPLAPGDPDDFGWPLSDAVSWIQNSPVYKTWKSKRGLHILHIKGGQSMDLLSRRICENLSEEFSTIGEYANAVVYFCFNRRDARSNNLQSMITSLLAQFISKYEHLSSIANLKDWMDTYHAFSDTALIHLFETVHYSIGYAEHEPTYMISCLDECDESLFPFLELLHTLSKISERRFRFIFTTSSQAEDRLQKAISSLSQDVFEVNMRDFPGSKETYEPAIQLLLQKKPAYRHVQEELQTLIDACSAIPYFGSVLLDWLTFGSSVTARVDIRKLVHALSPASPQIFLSVVFGSFGHRESRARQIYRWAVHTFEPLTMEELAIALNLEEKENLENTDEQEVCDDVQHFRRIFNLDVYEVSFSSFWKTIVAEEIELLKIEEAVHAEISRLCLRYLSLPTVLDKTHQMADACMSLSDMPLSRPRQNLISYAVRYWPLHYKSAGQKRPTAEATSFLQNISCRRAWEVAWFALSNPISRSERSYISALPLAARIGLEDVVAALLETEKPAAMFTAHHAMALSEAAQNGHGTIVKQLVQVKTPGCEYFGDILCAAAAHGDENTINDLITLADKNHFTNWPDDLFIRSAWLGLDSTLTLLISKGAIVPLNSDRGPNVLKLAAESRNSEVISILLQQEHIKATIYAPDGRKSSPLVRAAIYGDCKSLQLLLDNCGDKEVGSKEKTLSMHNAIVTGKPVALKLLLDNGAAVDEGIDLIYASIQGHAQCAGIVLETKVNVEGTFSGRTSLWYAANEGYYDICELMLQNGADPNNDPVDNLRILEVAVGANQDMDSRMKLVRLLVDKGARIHARNESVKEGTDFLSQAVQVGDRALVEYFLGHGLPPTSSALFQACSEDNRELVKLFLSLGVNPNDIVTKKSTPLHAAYKSADIVREMLVAGADINAESASGTILHMACKAGEVEIVQALLAHSPRPDLERQISNVGGFKAKEGEAGMTALCLACLCGDVRIARMLCDEGANVNHQAEDGRFPLQIALQSSSTLLVEMLLMYHPNLLLKDHDDNTVLHSLTAETPVATIKTLWGAGAPRNAVNKAGTSMIMAAAEEENTDAFLFFLSQGADINTCGQDGKPLLHILATQGNWQLFKAAVDAGADIHLAERLNYKRTLLYEVVCVNKLTEGHRCILEYLLDEAKCNPNSQCEKEPIPYPTMMAADSENEEACKILIAHGVDLNVEDKMGRRLIHLAAVKSSSILRILLATKGVDHMPRTITGMTPLHFAALRINLVGQEESLNILLGMDNTIECDKIEVDVGDINDTDDDGWTPLMWACKQNYLNVDAILILLNRGADLFATGTVLESNGKTSQWSPLKIARYFGSRQEVCDVLTPKQKMRILKDGTKKVWNDRDHETRGAVFLSNWTCDYCRGAIIGINYICVECEFNLCYKCYRSRQKLHPGHDFRPDGNEFENDEPEDVDEKKTSDVDDDDNANKEKEKEKDESDSESSSEESSEDEDEDEDNSDD